MGGGGFSMEPDNPLLDDFVLSLARRQPARVCFVATASADSAPYIVRFYRAFAGRCVPSDLTLTDGPLVRQPPRTADLPTFVASQDVFYVGGGNTANLLALWRVHGLDALFREAWLEGAVFAGVSAGMLCWFEGGVTDSFGGLEVLRDGLGFLKGTACPHYDGEPGRRPAYHRSVAEGAGAGTRLTTVPPCILPVPRYAKRSVRGQTPGCIAWNAPTIRLSRRACLFASFLGARAAQAAGV